MMRPKSIHAKNSGLTLVEAITGVAILSIVLIAIIAFQTSVIRTVRSMQDNLMMQREARRTLTMFVSELREAEQSAAGGYTIESAGTSSIVFFANIDNDAAIERVRYFLSTSTSPTVFDVLKKGVINPTGTSYLAANEKILVIARNLVNGTSTPIFDYYDSGYAGTSSPLAIPLAQIFAVRLVRMTLIIDPNANTPGTHRYQTQVTIRNLKDNL
jgi:Tfp pilus assembly protein PilE